MNNKQIVFTAPGIAEILDTEIREPKDNEVLVKTAFTTISAGTERANLVGNPSVSARRGSKPHVKFPRHCGYSASGTVLKIGKAVTGLQVGDRVAASWTTHSRFNTVEEKNIHKLPDSIDFDVASVVHIATFPLAAIRKCKVEIGESAIVMGLGILGMLAVQLLKAAGAVPIIAVDPVKEKREMALKYGATYALDPFEDGFADKALALTNGGANVAIEVTGNGKALDMVLDCMARFGRVALLGCTRESDFTIDYYRKVHGPGVSLIGAHTMARPDTESFAGYWTTHEDAMALLRLLEHGRIDFKSIIGEVHSPAEAAEVFTRLATEKNFPVTQFDWRDFE